jgi:hypothetical protein
LTQHPGYALSQCIRKRIEVAFDSARPLAGLRQARHHGLPKISWFLPISPLPGTLVAVKV